MGKKKVILTVIINSIFIVAFNLIFFMSINNPPSSSVWTCYGFLHFAYIMIVVTSCVEVKEYLSKLSTYAISFSYFLIELVLALIVFICEKTIGKTFGIKLVVSVQVILTVVFLVIWIINLLANDSTANKQARHKAENDFIKTIASKVKFIESISPNTVLKKRINNLYSTIHSSPVKSSINVATYEESIVGRVDELENLVEKQESEKANEILTEIERLINKRNLTLKAEQ